MPAVCHPGDRRHLAGVPPTVKMVALVGQIIGIQTAVIEVQVEEEERIPLAQRTGTVHQDLLAFVVSGIAVIVNPGTVRAGIEGAAAVHVAVNNLLLEQLAGHTRGETTIVEENRLRIDDDVHVSTRVVSAVLIIVGRLILQLATHGVAAVVVLVDPDIIAIAVEGHGLGGCRVVPAIVAAGAPGVVVAAIAATIIAGRGRRIRMPTNVGELFAKDRLGGEVVRLARLKRAAVVVFDLDV